MSNFATLLHGDLYDVLNELEAGELTTDEICAVLANLCKRVMQMERGE